MYRNVSCKSINVALEVYQEFCTTPVSVARHLPRVGHQKRHGGCLKCVEQGHAVLPQECAICVPRMRCQGFRFQCVGSNKHPSERLSVARVSSVIPRVCHTNSLYWLCFPRVRYPQEHVRKTCVTNVLQILQKCPAKSAVKKSAPFELGIDFLASSLLGTRTESCWRTSLSNSFMWEWPQNWRCVQPEPTNHKAMFLEPTYPSGMFTKNISLLKVSQNPSLETFGQVQGASSVDFCACVQGTFMWEDQCKAGLDSRVFIIFLVELWLNIMVTGWKWSARPARWVPIVQAPMSLRCPKSHVPMLSPKKSRILRHWIFTLFLLPRSS